MRHFFWLCNDYTYIRQILTEQKLVSDFFLFFYYLWSCFAPVQHLSLQMYLANV